MYGEIASAAAGLASGVMGSINSSHEAKALRKQAQYQFDQQMDTSVQRRVVDALKAGINPLVALGANTTASPTIHAGGTSGSGEIIANTGADVGNHLGNALNQALEDKAFDDLDYDRQVKSLDLESRRIQNRILQGQELQQQQNLAKGAARESTPKTAPSRQGEKALFIPVYDLKGRPRLVANQDVVEGDNDNAGYRATILTAIANGDIDKKTGEVKNPEVRKMLDQMYYDMTGHHIKNLQDLYISPTEMGLVSKDEAEQISRAILRFFKNKD